MVAPSAEGAFPSCGTETRPSHRSHLQGRGVTPFVASHSHGGRSWRLFLGMGMSSWLFLEPVGHPGAFPKGQRAELGCWCSAGGTNAHCGALHGGGEPAR